MGQEQRDVITHKRVALDTVNLILLGIKVVIVDEVIALQHKVQCVEENREEISHHPVFAVAAGSYEIAHVGVGRVIVPTHLAFKNTVGMAVRGTLFLRDGLIRRAAVVVVSVEEQRHAHRGHQLDKRVLHGEAGTQFAHHSHQRPLIMHPTRTSTAAITLSLSSCNCVHSKALSHIHIQPLGAHHRALLFLHRDVAEH